MNLFQRTAVGRAIGVAVVTDNVDPEGLCRVRVRYPWHARPQESHWARLAVPMAGEECGMVLIPEVDDEVLVGFDGGDLRHPYVLGALWNDRRRPPAVNEDGRNDRRALVSRKKHRLLFDDGERGGVELAHESGARVQLGDDGIAVEDRQGNRLTIDNRTGAMSIEAAGPLTIKAAAITLEASGALTLKAGAKLTIRGAQVDIN